MARFVVFYTNDKEYSCSSKIECAPSTVIRTARVVDVAVRGLLTTLAPGLLQQSSSSTLKMIPLIRLHEDRCIQKREQEKIFTRVTCKYRILDGWTEVNKSEESPSSGQSTPAPTIGTSPTADLASVPVYFHVGAQCQSANQQDTFTSAYWQKTSAARMRTFLNEMYCQDLEEGDCQFVEAMEVVPVDSKMTIEEGLSRGLIFVVGSAAEPKQNFRTFKKVSRSDCEPSDPNPTVEQKKRKRKIRRRKEKPTDPTPSEAKGTDGDINSLSTIPCLEMEVLDRKEHKIVLHDEKLSNDNTLGDANNEQPKEKEPLVGEAIRYELVTPGQMLIYQALMSLTNEVKSLRIELQQLNKSMRGEFMPEREDLNSNYHGAIDGWVGNLDLTGRLRRLKWVKDFSQPKQHLLELSDEQRALLDATLRQTKYHELLELLPEDDRKSLSSDVPSVQVDALCTITVDLTQAWERVQFHDKEATRLLNELDIGAEQRHLVLLNESTAMHISDAWWIDAPSDMPWPHRLKLIKKYLETVRESLAKSFCNFIHKMLQLERLATAWRITHRLPDGSLFPILNMLLAISSDKRPKEHYIELIVAAVPTVSEFLYRSQIMYVDKRLDSRDIRLELLFDWELE